MLLLDTCAFIWFLEDSPKLPQEAKTSIENSEMAYLSIVSLWEIAIKKSLGKLKIKQTIASTAMEERIPIVTHDSKIVGYDISVIW